MARNVAGEAAEVESLTKPGAEIHYYQPTPGRHPRARWTPTSMLWNGLNLEQWFERFLRNLGDVPAAVRQRGRRADGHRRGPLRGQAEPARLDVARATR